MRRAFFLQPLLIVSTILAQTNVVWEPPTWRFPQSTKATVRKEMVTKFRISDVPIILEETNLYQAEKTFGGTTGGKGDAANALHWLCLHGNDASGNWVLWLERGEIDGGYVGSFQWERLSNKIKFDGRCQALKGAKIRLPLALQLGISEDIVLKALGEPSLRKDDRLVYLHEHEGSTNGIPFFASNIVIVRLRGGQVVSIAVSKTATS